MNMTQEVFFVDNKTLIERRDRLLGKGAPLFYREPVHIVKGDGVWPLSRTNRLTSLFENAQPHLFFV